MSVDETSGPRVVRKLRAMMREKLRDARTTAERQQIERLLDLSDEALVDTLFNYLQPNPDRIGCPPRDLLWAWAHQQQPLEEPWLSHVRTCSPCRIDLRELSQT
jgi:hypothetical protein